MRFTMQLLRARKQIGVTKTSTPKPKADMTNGSQSFFSSSWNAPLSASLKYSSGSSHQLIWNLLVILKGLWSEQCFGGEQSTYGMKKAKQAGRGEEI